ncbi:hypothetical protein HPP92_028767 [Vanilla planifolia]|uniref:Uncharacterized protein n=1 Tax=Vanilla planifolia TaxID=51239 RepID=A0A835U3L6_VANPL|nr:hypothetical protein HPP92_028767 [Vanilla planifolia]
MADNEAEEDDEILNRNSPGEILAETDNQWDANIERKLAEFAAAYDKQVLLSTSFSLKRNLGSSDQRETDDRVCSIARGEASCSAIERRDGNKREGQVAYPDFKHPNAPGPSRASSSRMQCFRQASGNNSDVMTQELESAALWKHKETSEGCPSCEQEFYDIIGWRGPGF